MVLSASIYTLLVTFTYILSTGGTFTVEKSQRCTLITRTFIGVAVLVLNTYAIALVPITIVQTTQNMTPFYASLIAYFTIGESMTMFEIAAMIISFGTIVMIIFSN